MGRWGVTSEPLRPPLWAQRPLGARMEGRALHAQSQADESSSVEPTPPRGLTGRLELEGTLKVP